MIAIVYTIRIKLKRFRIAFFKYNEWNIIFLEIHKSINVGRSHSEK
jgi:hypothetical protein